MKQLAAKMLQVMKKVKYIQKTGYNSFHKYKYASEADISKAFSEAFVECGLAIFTSQIEYSQKVNGKNTLTNIKIKIVFVDVESGESFTGSYYGDAMDSGDKGLYKALTGAIKYALMKTFLVETGDDPERESPQIEEQKPIENDYVSPPKNLEDIKSQLTLSTIQGTQKFRDAWMLLSKDERDYIGADQEYMNKLKVMCNNADVNVEEDVPQ